MPVAHLEVLVVSCLGIALRSITSLGSYSGASTPPMFGDYEAQRHWQEITYNLPAKEWYLNSTSNDLQYWGLDYPPLTAYHSYLMGLVAYNINSSYVELFASRGYESEAHKSFMRFSVLLADVLLYIPACILLANALGKMFTNKERMAALMLSVCYPGLILIDNGHFQYNNISLGLMMIAVSAILRDSYIWAALSFSLALNYKQMELYHALPFFVYLLRLALAERTFVHKILKLLKIGLVTIATFVILWLPWIFSKHTFMATLSRLFPFNRGVFEDKVANIWCSLNVIYKFKENVTNSQMALICLTTTLLVVLQLNLHAFLRHQKKTFLFALFNTAIAFFLFSFQVHEKSILLAAIPAVCLFPYMPFYVMVFLKISFLSMLPLFIKDSLCIPYFCLTIGFALISKYGLQTAHSNNIKIQKLLGFLMDGIDLLILLISLVSIFAPSPTGLPHLWPLFISVFCCGCFVILLVISVAHQVNMEKYLHRLFYKIISIVINK
ncbi:ALG6 alpha-1,3-glucosyltransferase garnysstan [Haematobia irritans]|uniref:ALG6 alpha-1,3-glucosyltransferase garnysstan n=1 Tax=Haematobia irritans TaxID=7368 RepID=UPI003F501F7E